MRKLQFQSPPVPARHTKCWTGSRNQPQGGGLVSGVRAEVRPVLRCPHAWNSVPTGVTAPPQPPLCIQPPPVPGMPQLQAQGWQLQLHHPNALQSLFLRSAGNKPWAPAQTGWLPICSVWVGAKGLATSEVASPSEENLLQSIETTLLPDQRPGIFFPQVSGLGNSVTDPPATAPLPFLPPSNHHQSTKYSHP